VEAADGALDCAGGHRKLLLRSTEMFDIRTSIRLSHRTFHHR
jgi:hypothetical protein